MIRRPLGLCLAVALLLSGIGAPRPAAAVGGAGDPAIVVGVLATLSGMGALASQDVIDGANLALRHHGNRFANQEVRLVLADDQGSPDQAVAAVKRMLQTERVDFVLTAVSQPSLTAAMKPLLAARLFVLTLEPPPPAMAGEDCSPWLFSLVPPLDATHEVMGHHLQTRGVKHLAVIGPEGNRTRDALTALKRGFSGRVDPVIEVEHGTGTFTRPLKELAASGAEAVYMLLSGGQGVMFLRAFDEVGLRGGLGLYAPWLALERHSFSALGDAALGVVTVAPWSAEVDTPSNRRLSNEFESEFGRPPTERAALGYDAVLLLESAVRANNGRTVDSDAVRASLRAAQFPSTRGEFQFGRNQFPVTNWYARAVGPDARGRANHMLSGTAAQGWRDGWAGRCAMP